MSSWSRELLIFSVWVSDRARPGHICLGKCSSTSSWSQPPAPPPPPLPKATPQGLGDPSVGRRRSPLRLSWCFTQPFSSADSLTSREAGGTPRKHQVPTGSLDCEHCGRGHSRSPVLQAPTLRPTGSPTLWVGEGDGEAARLFGMLGEGLPQQQHQEEALSPTEGLAWEGMCLCSCAEQKARRLWAQATCGASWRGLTACRRQELAGTARMRTPGSEQHPTSELPLPLHIC